mmetsp:Transcript_115878/g.327917  ORF Transcript_115878/g.327917 Transcript_115878/m.327917 type:complete len:365 (-) Transcript_115878:195-1289(-)
MSGSKHNQLSRLTEVYRRTAARVPRSANHAMLGSQAASFACPPARSAKASSRSMPQHRSERLRANLGTAALQATSKTIGPTSDVFPGTTRASLLPPRADAPKAHSHALPVIGSKSRATSGPTLPATWPSQRPSRIGRSVCPTQATGSTCASASIAAKMPQLPTSPCNTSTRQSAVPGAPQMEYKALWEAEAASWGKPVEAVPATESTTLPPSVTIQGLCNIATSWHCQYRRAVRPQHLATGGRVVSSTIAPAGGGKARTTMSSSGTKFPSSSRTSTSNRSSLEVRLARASSSPWSVKLHQPSFNTSVAGLQLTWPCHANCCGDPADSPTRDAIATSGLSIRRKTTRTQPEPFAASRTSSSATGR